MSLKSLVVGKQMEMKVRKKPPPFRNKIFKELTNPSFFRPQQHLKLTLKTNTSQALFSVFLE